MPTAILEKAWRTSRRAMLSNKPAPILVQINSDHELRLALQIDKVTCLAKTDLQFVTHRFTPACQIGLSLAKAMLHIRSKGKGRGFTLEMYLAARFLGDRLSYTQIPQFPKSLLTTQVAAPSLSVAPAKRCVGNSVLLVHIRR